MGTGGGCVRSGPFANMTVNIGPTAHLEVNFASPADSAQKLQYNPRCLKRDFTIEALTRFANETSVLDLLRPATTPDVRAFDLLLSGLPGRPEMGGHGGGHLAMGGDPGRNIYVSPGDPLFWSHHANLDRVWWMWQMLDPPTRAGNVSSAIWGPSTWTGEGNGTLTDVQNMGFVQDGKKLPLGELLDSTGGIFCTVYE